MPGGARKPYQDRGLPQSGSTGAASGTFGAPGMFTSSKEASSFTFPDLRKGVALAKPTPELAYESLPGFALA